MIKTKLYIAIKGCPYFNRNDILCNTKRGQMMKLATSRNRMKNLPMINHRPDEEDFKQYFKEISSENFTYYDLKLIGPHLPTRRTLDEV